MWNYESTKRSGTGGWRQTCATEAGCEAAAQAGLAVAAGHQALLQLLQLLLLGMLRRAVRLRQ